MNVKICKIANRVVDADSVGLKVEYQYGTNETHPSAFLMRYFV